MPRERYSRESDEFQAALEAKIEEVTKLFVKKGWDERAPGMFRKWAQDENFRIEVSHPSGLVFPDIDLLLGAMSVYTQDRWGYIGLSEKTGTKSLDFRGHPVGEVRAIMEGDEGFDGVEKIEVTLPEYDLKVVLSGSEDAELLSMGGKD